MFRARRQIGNTGRDLAGGPLYFPRSSRDPPRNGADLVGHRVGIGLELQEAALELAFHPLGEIAAGQCRHHAHRL